MGRCNVLNVNNATELCPILTICAVSDVINKAYLLSVQASQLHALPLERVESPKLSMFVSDRNGSVAGSGGRSWS